MLQIRGSNFGSVAGALGMCATGASPCVPPWDGTPFSYTFT